jgi:hypothetical protein
LYESLVAAETYWRLYGTWHDDGGTMRQAAKTPEQIEQERKRAAKEAGRSRRELVKLGRLSKHAVTPGQ